MVQLGVWIAAISKEFNIELLYSDKNLFLRRSSRVRTYAGQDVRSRLNGSQDVSVFFQVRTPRTRTMKDCERAQQFLPKTLHHIVGAKGSYKDLRRGVCDLFTAKLDSRDIVGVERQGALADEERKNSGRWFRRVQSSVAYPEAVMCLLGNRQQIVGESFNAGDDGPKYLWIDAFCGTSPVTEVAVKYGMFS